MTPLTVCLMLISHILASSPLYPWTPNLTRLTFPPTPPGRLSICHVKPLQPHQRSILQACSRPEVLSAVLECAKDSSRIAEYEHDPDVKKVQVLCAKCTNCCKHHTYTCCILIDAVELLLVLLFPEPNINVYGVQTLTRPRLVMCYTAVKRAVSLHTS